MKNINFVPLSQDNLLLGKNLLAKFTKGQIDMTEFEKEIAYFALECGFDELHYLDFPPRPQELEAFNVLGERQRGEVNENFWRQEVIAAYFKKWHEADGWNRGTKWWLKELLGRFIKYEDHINTKRVEERLLEWADQF